MKQKYILEKITTYLFYASILFFLIAFNFQDSKTSGWYQQFLPNLGGRNISDIFFLDSLTGWAVTPYTTQNDTAFVIKTTNGGDNWFIACRGTGQFVGSYRVKFINLNTGFIAGSVSSTYTAISKTTNGGINWYNINSPAISSQDMSVLDENIIWYVNNDGLAGGAFLTTNGGLSWQVKYSQTAFNPSHIYMYNARIGFMDGGGLKKTTNGGDNWILITGETLFSYMYFIDSLLGWKINGGIIKKTTNGGLNWTTQVTPTGGNILGNGAAQFTNVNKDTIWAVGETLITNGSPWVRGILFRTTNGGINWVYQLPDTTIHIVQYLFGKFVNKRIGWAYHFSPTGIHTTVGGDTTFVMSTSQISSKISNEYKLEQNYPNPFNSMTNVKFQMLNSGFAELKIFDISGRLIKSLVNQNLKTGEHSYKFDGGSLSSGIYFYSLFVDGTLIDTKKMILIK